MAALGGSAPDPQVPPVRATDPLSRAHRYQLEVESGIPPEFIAERGYLTVTTKADLRRRGFGDRQLNVPALLMPAPFSPLT